MKKILISAMCIGMLFTLSYAGNAEETTSDKENTATLTAVKDCQAADLKFVENLGAGDEASLYYNNVYARFVQGETEFSSYWFYVYEKGRAYLLNGKPENGFNDFPQYIAVRVYTGDREDEIRTKHTGAVKETGIFIMTFYNEPDTIEPFYFTQNNQNHAVNRLLQKGATAVLSADFDGRQLASFEANRPIDPFRPVACGQEKPLFTDMLKAVTVL